MNYPMARPTALAAVLLAAACAHHHDAGAVAQPSIEPVEVILAVTNHQFLDVTVFVEHDGLRTRVGTITAASAEDFKIPWRVFGQNHTFRLFAEVVGNSSTLRTETLTIQPGQIIEWTLENDLQRSSVGIL